MTVVKRCEVCGREFRTTRSTQRTCSRECRGKARYNRVALVCEHCGASFVVKAAIAHRSRYCSYACYWAAGGPARNIPRKARTGAQRYARVYLGRDESGKPRYMQRSHAVWNAHNPDDPVKQGEHIHHLDRDTRNDDITNLVKLSGREHAQMHAGELSAEERQRRSRIAAPKAAQARRTGTPATCPVCGTEFYRPPSARAVCCSYVCARELKRRQ